MARVRVKMCGMTQLEDVLHAVSLGVDAVGFIFYEQSRRYISPKQAQALIQRLPAFVDAVAVFVNPTAEFVEEVLDLCSIQYLQFHGEESPDFCTQFAMPYIKVVAATSAVTIEASANIHSKAAAILLDTPSEHYGGTGQVFDWQLMPNQSSKPIILAGGLTSQNVKEACRYAPFALDVCSGVESEPGIKDHRKMNEFVKAVWGAL